ncbi:MAG: protein kinase [Deltaproteobacteria bacterium]|nr:protein kinase [Deltaproteobacteria bacterium]
MQPPAHDERDKCLDAETLAAYLDGLLPTDAVARADGHIDRCRACRGEMSALAATFPEGSGGTPEELDGVLPIGPRLGRYEVLGEIGRGNMGVVVRAYDPELQRTVAVKLLAPKLWHGTAARERLRREAQAMARLSHPNVVHVYDVAAHGDALAIAMELVEGATLRSAISDGRPWRELLGLCVAAGRGLAAAHAARLIHRDFKPENVLIAGERVAVSDFGLARIDDAAAPPANAPLTATTLAGTPAYMAPELLRGATATTASDQFSFCVTTYEAIHGERPFAGSTLEALRDAMLRGEVRPAPPGVHVPAAIRAALLRGLAPDPARRFSTMGALLDALEARPSRRRWWIAGAALAIGTAAALGLALRPDTQACETVFVWDRMPVLGALGVDGARLAAAVDRYGATWSKARRDLCEVRGEQSERAHDARFACLDRSAREVRELVGLAVAEPTATARVLAALPRVRDPGSCGAGADDLAIDPRLDHANALLGAGKTGEAKEIADAVIASQPAPASLAEALLLRGRVEASLGKLKAAEATFVEAVTAAERARADQLVATIWVELVHVTGAQLHRFDSAEAHMRAAQVAFARADPGPAVRGRFAYVSGATHLAAGKFDLARTDLQRALAIGDPADHGLIHAALCDVERNVKNADAARVHCRTAIDRMTSAFGPDHPQLAPTYNTWGAIEVGERKTAAGRALFGKAIAIWEHAGIETDRGLALALSNTATTFMDEDKLDLAQPLFERARDLFASHHADHAQRVLPLQGLAAIALERGDLRGAIVLYEQALAVIERVYGKDSEDWLVATYNLALTYQRVPDLAKASELAREITDRALHPGREQWTLAAYGLHLQGIVAGERAESATQLALFERALAAIGTRDPYVRAMIAQDLGVAYRARRKVAQSIAPLEAAVAYYEEDRSDRYSGGTARFALARSLWDTGERARALAMAKAARDDLAAAETGYRLDKARAELAGWLTERGAK